MIVEIITVAFGVALICYRAKLRLEEKYGKEKLSKLKIQLEGYFNQELEVKS